MGTPEEIPEWRSSRDDESSFVNGSVLSPTPAGRILTTHDNRGGAGLLPAAQSAALNPAQLLSASVIGRFLFDLQQSRIRIESEGAFVCPDDFGIYAKGKRICSLHSAVNDSRKGGGGETPSGCAV